MRRLRGRDGARRRQHGGELRRIREIPAMVWGWRSEEEELEEEIAQAVEEEEDGRDEDEVEKTAYYDSQRR